MTKVETARSLALAVLEDVLVNQAYSNIALNKHLKGSQLSVADKGLVTEIVVENQTAPVSHSAPSETEVSETKYSETDSLFIEDEEDRNTQPILKRKVEKVTKYDRDYIWGLVQDQFRREGFSETASEIAMTDFEKLYQYALDNVRFVRRAEELAEFVFNGLYSVWNNRVRKGGG